VNAAQVGDTVTVPAWVAEKVREWQACRKSGTISLNFSDGTVRNIEERHIVHPPKQ
jgi:hypothetical protein